MKKFFVVLSLLAVAAVLNQANVLPGEAEAAPKFAGKLITDGGTGGPTFTLCLDAGIGNQAMVQLQNLDGTQYCLKTCTTVTCTANCANDWRANQETVTRTDGGGNVTLTPQPYMTPPIRMRSDRCLNAYALDAGNPGINVFLIGEGEDYRPNTR